MSQPQPEGAAGMSTACRRCSGPLGDEVDAGVCAPCQLVTMAEEAGMYDLSPAYARRRRDAQAVAEGRAITCPECEMTSYNPDDVREGYCGHCHHWTGLPLALRRPRPEKPE